MEIEWVHSPSQTMATSSTPHYHHVLTQKQACGDNQETTDEDDSDEHPKYKRKVNAAYLTMCLFTVSPDLPQKTQNETQGDSDDVLRNNKVEGNTEKEGDNAMMDDGGTECEEDVL